MNSWLNTAATTPTHAKSQRPSAASVETLTSQPTTPSPRLVEEARRAVSKPRNARKKPASSHRRFRDAHYVRSSTSRGMNSWLNTAATTPTHAKSQRPSAASVETLTSQPTTPSPRLVEEARRAVSKPRNARKKPASSHRRFRDAHYVRSSTSREVSSHRPSRAEHSPHKDVALAQRPQARATCSGGRIRPAATPGVHPWPGRRRTAQPAGTSRGRTW